MFSDESLDCVEFKSCWKRERQYADSGSQTREVLTDEVACQAMKKHTVQTQTEELDIHNFQFMEDNSEEILQFLNRVTPYICKELDKNLHSHAFDGYSSYWDHESVAISSLYTLHNADHDEKLQITGLTWNCTGSTVAAAYGRFDHEDWCTHKSTLSTWNVDLRSLKCDKPDLNIDLSSCLMCIAYHPKNPAMIAGGTFNGEVLVWDTSQEDEMLVATSGIGDDSHKEPVSKVHWVLDPDSKGKKYNIVSVSGDGKILTWQMVSKQRNLTLLEGRILLTESLPRAMRRHTKQGNREMGVTSISYNHEDNSIFMIGSESGGVFKCSRQARGTPAGSHVESSVPLTSPVTVTYTPHQGPVYSVDCSPYHRNLFITCASDASARLYSMIQSQPVATIEPGMGYLFSAKWSPIRPLVFAVTTENGDLLIYDLKHSLVTPLHKLQASPKRAPVYSLQFNLHQRDLLATGDGMGYIQIWKLGEALTSQSVQEEQMLADIADQAGE